jgi:hypothetical protein
MQLTLVLPNLLDAEPDTLDAAAAPALARLLGASGSPVPKPGGAPGIACDSLGIAKQHDWPIAPLLASAAGIDAGHSYWLCAQPVALALERGEGRLASMVTDLDADQSASLLASLRAHFASDGMEFVDRGPGRWWASLAEAQQLETSPPYAALGKPLIAHLPRGEDAARWRRWQSEMQMILFEHPVNRAREKSGRATVDYVWMWGGGVLRGVRSDAHATALFAHSPLVRDLSRALGRDGATLPPSLAALRVPVGAASALVWLDDIDKSAIRKQLAAFDANWAAPLERAIDRQEIEATIVAAGAERALSFAPRTTGALRRLRRRWSALPALPALLKMDGDA